MRVAVPEPGLSLCPLHRAAYDQLVASGTFDDTPVELLEGALVEMRPDGPRHRFVLDRLAEHLIGGVADDLAVRVAGPWAAGAVSEPEPDLAVVPRQRYDRAHPDRALLLVEVSETSLRKDLVTKARVYAAAGATEYWVVDLSREVRTWRLRS